MKDLVLYHDNCTDGIFAAYAHFTSPDRPVDSVYHAVSYGRNWDKLLQDLNRATDNNLKSHRVYILDFSYPPDELVILASMCKELVLLDHHKSAMDEYIGYMTSPNQRKITVNITVSPIGNALVHFDLDQSGAMLAFKHFHGPAAEVPWYYTLVQDRDLWIHEYLETQNFSSGIRVLLGDINYTCPDDFEYLTDVLKDKDTIMSTGNVVKQVRDQRIKEHVRRGPHRVTISHGGQTYRVGFINSDGDLSSDLGNYLVTHESLDIAVMYMIDKYGIISCSIRSSDKVDSLFFAQHHGGGGHPQANGCRMDMKTLQHYLSTNLLPFH